MEINTITFAWVVALSSVLTPIKARAAVLTFDMPVNPVVDQAYGDNITAATNGDFSYGVAQGFTPDITVAYEAGSPQLWATGYGDLKNGLTSDSSDQELLVLTFTATSGFDVRLHSFDLAATGFSSDETINSVTVFDGNNNILFSQTNPKISISSHTSFTFGTPLTAQVLKVKIDAQNTDSDDIGIDNVTFSQIAVPEPTYVLLLASSIAFLGVTHRRNLPDGKL